MDSHPEPRWTSTGQSAEPAEPTARYPRTLLATCCVPWRDGRFDEELFRKSVRWLINAGIDDLYIFGTAGEGNSVSSAQFRLICDVFADETAGGATPMVGVISTSVATVHERIEYAQSVGISRFQISLPNWGPIADRELASFFREVCDGHSDAVFMHYNLDRAGRVVTPDEYRRLVDLHENLVATKYGAAELEMVAGLMRNVPELRHFFTELGYYVGAALGPCGLLASIAITNPQLARRYFEYGIRQDFAALAGLFSDLAGMMSAIRHAVGQRAPRQDGAFDKVLSRIIDPAFPLDLLPPYEGSGSEQYQAYLEALRRDYPAWLPPNVG